MVAPSLRCFCIRRRRGEGNRDRRGGAGRRRCRPSHPNRHGDPALPAMRQSRRRRRSSSSHCERTALTHISSSDNGMRSGSIASSRPIGPLLQRSYLRCTSAQSWRPDQRRRVAGATSGRRVDQAITSRAGVRNDRDCRKTRPPILPAIPPASSPSPYFLSRLRHARQFATTDRQAASYAARHAIASRATRSCWRCLAGVPAARRHNTRTMRRLSEPLRAGAFFAGRMSPSRTRSRTSSARPRPGCRCGSGAGGGH